MLCTLCGRIHHADLIASSCSLFDFLFFFLFLSLSLSFCLSLFFLSSSLPPFSLWENAQLKTSDLSSEDMLNDSLKISHNLTALNYKESQFFVPL